MPQPMPRVFIVRHGETEWSKSGQFTSFTDLDLLPDGVEQARMAGALHVGKGKLVDPDRVARIFVSPRLRARHTCDIILPASSLSSHTQVTVTEDIAEWNYGKLEGKLKHEIRQMIKPEDCAQGTMWDVWKDGCPGGESVDQVTERLDKFISEVEEFQRSKMDAMEPADVVLVAHGHILRCLVKRWLGFGLPAPLSLKLAPAGVGVLGYNDRDFSKHALYAGLPLPGQE